MIGRSPRRSRGRRADPDFGHGRRETTCSRQTTLVAERLDARRGDAGSGVRIFFEQARQEAGLEQSRIFGIGRHGAFPWPDI